MRTEFAADAVCASSAISAIAKRVSVVAFLMTNSFGGCGTSGAPNPSAKVWCDARTLLERPEACAAAGTVLRRGNMSAHGCSRAGLDVTVGSSMLREGVPVHKCGLPVKCGRTGFLAPNRFPALRLGMRA